MCMGIVRLWTFCLLPFVGTAQTCNSHWRTVNSPCRFEPEQATITISPPQTVTLQSRVVCKGLVRFKFGHWTYRNSDAFSLVRVTTNGDTVLVTLGGYSNVRSQQWLHVYTPETNTFCVRATFRQTANESTPCAGNPETFSSDLASFVHPLLAPNGWRFSVTVSYSNPAGTSLKFTSFSRKTAANIIHVDDAGVNYKAVSKDSLPTGFQISDQMKEGTCVGRSISFTPTLEEFRDRTAWSFGFVLVDGNLYQTKWFSVEAAPATKDRNVSQWVRDNDYQAGLTTSQFLRSSASIRQTAGCVVVMKGDYMYLLVVLLYTCMYSQYLSGDIYCM